MERYQAALILGAVGNVLGYQNRQHSYWQSVQKLSGSETTQELEGAFQTLWGCQVPLETLMHMATAEALVSGWESLHTFYREAAKKYLMALDRYHNRQQDLGKIGEKFWGLFSDKCIGHSPSLIKMAKFGTAARSMCIGMCYSKPEQLNDLLQASIECGRMTNSYPTGFLGSLCVALFTSYAIQGKPVVQWGYRMLEVMPIAEEYCKKKIKQFSDYRENWFYFETKWQLYLQQRQIDKKGCNKPIFPANYNITEKNKLYRRWCSESSGRRKGSETTLMVYDALLATRNNWNKLCIWAMMHEGDSDSTGAIAGCLYGILYGFDNVATCLYQHLEIKELLEKMGKELYHVASGDRTQKLTSENLLLGETLTSLRLVVKRFAKMRTTDEINNLFNYMAQLEKSKEATVENGKMTELPIDANEKLHETDRKPRPTRFQLLQSRFTKLGLKNHLEKLEIKETGEKEGKKQKTIKDHNQKSNNKTTNIKNKENYCLPSVPPEPHKETGIQKLPQGSPYSKCVLAAEGSQVNSDMQDELHQKQPLTEFLDIASHHVVVASEKPTEKAISTTFKTDDSCLGTNHVTLSHLEGSMPQESLEDPVTESSSASYLNKTNQVPQIQLSKSSNSSTDCNTSLELSDQENRIVNSETGSSQKVNEEAKEDIPRLLKQSSPVHTTIQTVNSSLTSKIYLEPNSAKLNDEIPRYESAEEETKQIVKQDFTSLREMHPEKQLIDIAVERRNSPRNEETKEDLVPHVVKKSSPGYTTILNVNTSLTNKTYLEPNLSKLNDEMPQCESAEEQTKPIAKQDSASVREMCQEKQPVDIAAEKNSQRNEETKEDLPQVVKKSSPECTTIPNVNTTSTSKFYLEPNSNSSKLNDELPQYGSAEKQTNQDSASVREMCQEKQPVDIVAEKNSPRNEETKEDLPQVVKKSSPECTTIPNVNTTSTSKFYLEPNSNSSKLNDELPQYGSAEKQTNQDSASVRETYEEKQPVDVGVERESSPRNEEAKEGFPQVVKKSSECTAVQKVNASLTSKFYLDPNLSSKSSKLNDEIPQYKSAEKETKQDSANVREMYQEKQPVDIAVERKSSQKEDLLQIAKKSSPVHTTIQNVSPSLTSKTYLKPNSAKLNDKIPQCKSEVEVTKPIAKDDSASVREMHQEQPIDIAVEKDSPRNEEAKEDLPQLVKKSSESTTVLNVNPSPTSKIYLEPNSAKLDDEIPPRKSAEEETKPTAKQDSVHVREIHQEKQPVGIAIERKNSPWKYKVHSYADPSVVSQSPKTAQKIFLRGSDITMLSLPENIGDLCYKEGN
uniref:ADP-ribosylhydrolase like 1 n=1 Tax=Latimeria chalumnae TaxID=7897 RepID=H3BFH5_LATCH